MAPSAALLSASDALQRLLETVNAMSVAAAGEDIMQYGAQVLQRPAGVGGSVRPPTKQPDAESPFTALLIGLIAGGSFCGLGFAVGLVALTWRYASGASRSRSRSTGAAAAAGRLSCLRNIKTHLLQGTNYFTRHTRASLTLALLPSSS